MATPEKILENRILEWLNSVEHCFAFKINNVGIYDAKRKTWRKNNNPHIHNGISDILFCYQGTFGAIEVKAGYNKPSPSQKKYLQRILDNGGVSWWTNNFDECKKEFIRTFPKLRYKNKPLFDEEF
jgi:hypothetical protein